MWLWILNYGPPILDADCVAQAPDGLCAAPEVSELSVTVQIYGTPNDVIMDMRFINMGADYKGMVAFGESLCKFYSQPVGFFRRNFTGQERLAHMIGNYIVRAAHPSGGGNVLTLCQQELSISGSAVTSKAGDKSAIVRLMRIGRIVDDVADRLAFRAAFADMQRHDTRGCHDKSSFHTSALAPLFGFLYRKGFILTGPTAVDLPFHLLDTPSRFYAFLM